MANSTSEIYEVDRVVGGLHRAGAARATGAVQISSRDKLHESLHETNSTRGGPTTIGRRRLRPTAHVTEDRSVPSQPCRRTQAA
jgi:hypothetical protein